MNNVITMMKGNKRAINETIIMLYIFIT